MQCLPEIYLLLIYWLKGFSEINSYQTLKWAFKVINILDTRLSQVVIKGLKRTQVTNVLLTLRIALVMSRVRGCKLPMFESIKIWLSQTLLCIQFTLIKTATHLLLNQLDLRPKSFKQIRAINLQLVSGFMIFDMIKTRVFYIITIQRLKLSNKSIFVLGFYTN